MAGELISLSGKECFGSGPAGIASKKRGRPSNHRLPQALHERAVAIVRERYVDFGPTLANEKLGELHDVRVGRETPATRWWRGGPLDGRHAGAQGHPGRAGV